MPELTRREQFAIQILAGSLSCDLPSNIKSREDLINLAVRSADALCTAIDATKPAIESIKLSELAAMPQELANEKQAHVDTMAKLHEAELKLSNHQFATPAGVSQFECEQALKDVDAKWQEEKKAHAETAAKLKTAEAKLARALADISSKSSCNMYSWKDVVDSVTSILQSP